MINYNSLDTTFNDVLGRHGLQGGQLGAYVDGRNHNLAGRHVNLWDAFLKTRAGRGNSAFVHRTGRGPSLFTTRPAEAQARFWAGQGVGAPRTFDLGEGGSGLRGRIQAIRLERALRRDPVLRQALEDRIGGRVVGFGVADGRLQVQRGVGAAQTAADPSPFRAGSPAMATAGGLLGALDAGIAEAVRHLAQGQLGQAGGRAMVPGKGAGLGGVPGPADATSAEIDNVMNDPSMTVEDKITMLLMLLMKRADKDIENQGERLAALQRQQQGFGAAAGPGGGFGGLGLLGGLAGAGAITNPDGSAPSVDMESMKLKRMVDKRGQMFDTLRSIIDRYNETAKNLIQSMGR
jgi:hypothetical protein